MSSTSDDVRRAWVTRRAKYGKSGMRAEASSESPLIRPDAETVEPLRAWVRHKVDCELESAEVIAMEPNTYDGETTYPIRRRTENDPPAVCTCGLSAALAGQASGRTPTALAAQEGATPPAERKKRSFQHEWDSHDPACAWRVSLGEFSCSCIDSQRVAENEANRQQGKA